MMKRLLLILFLPLLILANPLEGQANTVRDYATPVKVKLVPSINFNVKTTGPYRLLNVDNQKEVSFSGEVQFRHTPNQVTARVNGRDFTSNRGFELQELVSVEQNFTTVSSIQQGSNFNTVEYRGSLKVEPGASRLTLFNTLDIEDYIQGVVPKEMPASWHLEALKAQAIAARNYAYVQMGLSDHMVDTVTNQVYGGKSGEHTRANEAVRATRGQYATANGKVINAFFHSSSGGHTENSENVWSSALSYIKAVPDPYDVHPSNTNNAWTTQIQRSTIEQRLFGTGVRLVDVKVDSRTPNAKSVQKVTATGVRANGEKVTVQLPSGTPDSLRSAFGSSLKSINFTVKPSPSTVQVRTANGSIQNVNHLYGAKVQTGDGKQSTIIADEVKVRTASSTVNQPTSSATYSFEGGGWGHRLGMSQWGARGMAEAGKKYDEILKHYYTGIRVETLR